MLLQFGLEESRRWPPALEIRIHSRQTGSKHLPQMPFPVPRWTETQVRSTAPGEKHSLVSTATMSNQTDGRRSAKKKHSTTREPLHRPPVTATGLLCRPQNTPHDPCKSLRSRGNSQSEPQPGPGSASATLWATTSSVRNRPRLLVPASVHLDNGHSLPTRPSLSTRYLDATQCNAILSPPSAALSTTGQVPAKSLRSTVLDAPSPPSTSSTPPPCLDSSLASPTLERHTAMGTNKDTQPCSSTPSDGGGGAGR